MVIIDAREVGTGSFARLCATGTLTRLTDRHGLPADLESSPGLRALAFADAVPRCAALAGLAACWVHGLAPEPPRVVELAVWRGARPSAPPAWDAARWRWFTDGRTHARAISLAGVAVVSRADAVATALRLSPLAPALAAAWEARRSDASLAARVTDVLDDTPAHAPGAARARSAWAAVGGAASAAGVGARR